jgi:CHAD domain-containing protein
MIGSNSKTGSNQQPGPNPGAGSSRDNGAKRDLAGQQSVDPVIQVAIDAVRTRLKRVRRLMSKAAKKGRHDAERIHQLRVATRRAAAALDLYGEFLPRKRTKRMRKLLTKIRKTAGEIRDCDILLLRFASERPPDHAPAFVKRIRSMRRRAEGKLEQLHKKRVASRRLKRKIAALTRRTLRKASHHSDRSSRSFSEWAPNRLRIFVSDFFEAAAPNLDQFGELHRFRIRTKALRYAMEFVAPAFPSELTTELMPVVERVQTLLGAINDEFTFLTNVGKRLTRKNSPADVEELRRRLTAEQAALDNLDREFATWWTAARRDGLKRRFDELAAAPRA